MPFHFKNKKASWIIEAFWVGFGLGASVLALLAGTFFLTQLLSTAEYGKLALAISLTALAVQILGDPVGRTAVRFYAHCSETGGLDGLLLNLCRSLLFSFIIIVIACVAILIAGYSLNFFEEPYFVIITGIFTILLLLNRVASGLEDAARKRRFRGLIQGAFEVLRFFFAIILVIFLTSPDAQTVLAGFVIAGLLIAAAHGFFLLRLLIKANTGTNTPSLGSASETVSMAGFQAPLMISNACIWIVIMAERWILNHFGHSGDVGGYAAVYQLSFIPMLFISNFLILLIEPILYQAGMPDFSIQKSSQTLQINKYAVVAIMVVTLILFSTLLVFHQKLGNYFLGQNFRSYSWLFPWLLLSGGFFAASQQLLLILSYKMRTDLLALLWAIVAAMAVALYLIGSMYWQVKGIVMAVVSVNSLLLLLSIFFSKKY